MKEVSQILFICLIRYMVHITRVSKKHKDTKIRGHNTSQEVLDDIDIQYGS